MDQDLKYHILDFIKDHNTYNSKIKKTLKIKCTQ